MHSLRILQLLDELHLELFHLHDFFLLLLAQVVLAVDAIFMVLLHLMDAPLAVLFDFHRSQPLLLIHDLVLHAVLLLYFKVLELLFLFVLLFDYLGLLGLLALRLEDRFLHLALLFLALFVDREVRLSDHPLVLVGHLVVVDFLHRQGSTYVTVTAQHSMVFLCSQSRRLTFCMRSSLRFLSVKISFVRFFVSSIFFHVFCSSYFSRAMRLAKSCASRSMLDYHNRGVSNRIESHAAAFG